MREYTRKNGKFSCHEIGQVYEDKAAVSIYAELQYSLCMRMQRSEERLIKMMMM